VTTADLIARVTPVARVAVPFVLRPWVPRLVRLAVEIAVGMMIGVPAFIDLVAWVILSPMLNAEWKAILTDLQELLKTPKSSLSPEVRAALDATASSSASGGEVIPDPGS
jgi:hypothetical protein